MEVTLEFEVVASAGDEENARVFYARRTVEIPGLPERGNLFRLPGGVQAACHNVFFTYVGEGRYDIEVGLGSVACDDFDSFYRALRDDGFDLTERSPLE